MKYVPRDLGESAENSSGGGRRGLLTEVVTLSGLTIAVVGLLYFLTGWITDWAVVRISPEREAMFFQEMMEDAFTDPVPEDFELKWQRAEAIFVKLQEAPGVLPLRYRLAYSDESEPNAFAVPGGQIVLTRGLLESLEEEVAIAFVLAHELGHFVGRDHLQRMGRQLGFGTALKLLTGASSGRLIESGTGLLDLSYSREEEMAADRFALQSLDAVYGDRAGAERLFEILEADRGLPKWAYMFLTHPANVARIQEIHSEAPSD
ncbi:M48 family metallopeptidase [Coraliomargarita sp. W4R72]